MSDDFMGLDQNKHVRRERLDSGVSIICLENDPLKSEYVHYVTRNYIVLLINIKTDNLFRNAYLNGPNRAQQMNGPNRAHVPTGPNKWLGPTGPNK